ncbi:MAG: glycosyltransferase family 39 protein, partial [Candidatus Wildermuthbacteria bacterium]|nr:glycosyltransferase family 39 protein [Candidatus Wildermuthbacteria bacterium]
MFLSSRLTNFIAVGLLLFVFLITLFSVKGDSLTMDELAHLPAGYSYLTQKDMRLNPEHPPLIKDLAAIPLLFIKDIHFPSDIKAWKDDINGQWDFGNNFLFKSGNPADKMIFAGRIPMILLLLLLGFYIFKIAKEFFGNKTALLSLFLFSFSPTLLAHGRLVTTDVGAAFGVVLATYYFLKSLRNPTFKNIILAGLAFGVAELLKFSLILLVPFFIFLGIIYWRRIKVLISVFGIGAILIGLVYQYHIWNYPSTRQVSDAKLTLASFQSRPVADLLVWMADKPVLRPYAQYGLGLAMVLQRTAGGNTTYFFGEVSSTAWKKYFPTVYLIKEPLAFHILTLLALIFAVWGIKRFRLKQHFPVFAMLSFIGIYWVTSMTSNLNIGVRHLLPIFPFAIILVSAAIARLLKEPYLKLRYAALGILILWQAITVIKVYPSFLAYFNELAGGPSNGYKYVADSNLDWGQDLKKLKKWIDENPPAGGQVYLDYFGGADTKYYFKEKYAPWWGDRNPAELPKGSYLAVSAT